MSYGVGWYESPGRLLVVNYMVGLPWLVSPQTNLDNFLQSSNLGVKRVTANRFKTIYIDG